MDIKDVQRIQSRMRSLWVQGIPLRAGEIPLHIYAEEIMELCLLAKKGLEAEENGIQQRLV